MRVRIIYVIERTTSFCDCPPTVYTRKQKRRVNILQTDQGQIFAASRQDGRSTDTPQPLISIVIKCYNEQDRIASCIESAMAVTHGLDTEIIVADALSTDKTVDIARRYPVRIVQMGHPTDRGCAAISARLGIREFPGLAGSAG